MNQQMEAHSVSQVKEGIGEGRGGRVGREGRGKEEQRRICKIHSNIFYLVQYIT